MSLGAGSRDDLRADCTRCAALCCIEPALRRSADFAIDQPAGRPCPNLGSDDGSNRCSIHHELRSLGFAGCAAYDCFGAGQHVVLVTFGGGGPRRDPTDPSEAAVFAAYRTVRDLHELRWYLADAADRPLAAGLRAEVADLAAHLAQLDELSATELVDVDVAAVRQRVDVVLAPTAST